jgi:hypothetical protein
MHTVKNNLIVDVEERLVRSLSSTYAGSVHDKRICDEEAYVFPPGCVLFKDTGFQGYEPDNLQTYQPKKKPRGQALTPADKAENTMISRIRIGGGTCDCWSQTLPYRARCLPEYQSPI